MKEKQFVDENEQIDLDEIFEEIEFLYKNYGRAEDRELTRDARELKDKINNFVYDVAGLVEKYLTF